MSRWKEHHYARAAEFARLVTEALDGARGSSAPTPAAPAAQPSSAPKAPPPPAPTAAAIFKSIPWKK